MRDPQGVHRALELVAEEGVPDLWVRHSPARERNGTRDRHFKVSSFFGFDGIRWHSLILLPWREELEEGEQYES